jgi:hypothetical protein
MDPFDNASLYDAMYGERVARHIVIGGCDSVEDWTDISVKDVRRGTR